MSRTLVISDQLFERLDRAARTEGLGSVEDLLARMSEPSTGDDRRDAVERIRALRMRLQRKYGEMPDSTDLIRADRDR